MYDDLDEPIYDENQKPNGNDVWFLFTIIMIVVAMYCFYILKG